ncbi:hypothetical protein O6H91_15G030700 [Diphasiastrum complanatum]|uniref:Uncharacterized protein n=1 Tax=Diphasiastrum complanatum TaxID=34168 RepID=A0ACC2BGT0_DIPCM|nr:hypothetical protein O6H91_15G030700 [Diphasiastrum complanatum]
MYAFATKKHTYQQSIDHQSGCLLTFLFSKSLKKSTCRPLMLYHGFFRKPRSSKICLLTAAHEDSLIVSHNLPTCSRGYLSSSHQENIGNHNSLPDMMVDSISNQSIS